MLKEIIKKIGWMGILFVIVPTSLSVFYFCVFATDVYISEAKFIVRNPEKQSISGLGSLFGGAQFSNAGDEPAAVLEYIRSRDALKDADRNGAIRMAYNRSSIFFLDRASGLFGHNSNEELYEFFGKMVRAETDASTGVTVLRVKAYSPEEAYQINNRLLELSEVLVNKLSARTRSDLIKFASAEVEDAKAKATVAAQSLANFRNKTGIVDPEKQAQLELQMVSKLQDELIAGRVKLAQLKAITPSNPQIPVLGEQIESLQEQIERQISRVAGENGSLSSRVQQYLRLQLEAQFADKQLGAALASLEDAQNEARRKQAYLERIAQPSHPDFAVEPHQLRGIVATLLMGLIAWGIVSMLYASVRDHVE